MKNRKLNYRFHNPNTVEETADYILKVFIKANERKVEEAIRTAAGRELPESADGQGTLPGIHKRFMVPWESPDMC